MQRQRQPANPERPDAFFYEAFAEEADALRRRLPERITAGFTWKTIQEQGDVTPPAAIVSIRTQSVIPATWAADLKAILARATGYDYLRTYRDQCDREMTVGYLPLYCHRAVAEQALLLWLALLRKLRQQADQFSSFCRDGITGVECEKKNLLVVGVGNIGSEVARIGQGLGMEVRGVDIMAKHEFVSYTTIEESLAWADVIVCAMNLTEENAGYFDYDLLKNSRCGAVFVNVARGELSPAADLLRLIEEGCLGGIGLDVYNHESELAVALRQGRHSEDAEVRATLALAEKPNVILTPHNSFNTREAVERKVAQSIEQIEHFLDYGKFLWPVPAG